MENNENTIQIGFFKRIFYSISKFEKYPEMAALGLKKALLYLAGLILINSIIFTAVFIYYIQKQPTTEENLNFSEKVVNQILSNAEIEEEQVKALSENIGSQNSGVLIISLGIGFFISLFLTTLIDVLTLSAFGLITCLIAKIKIKYKALFNMSIYAITLSVILRTLYLVIVYLTTFRIKYFDIMYIAISYISLAAAIFIIKSNLIKHQLQLMKIIEDNKENVDEPFTIENQNEEEQEEKDSKKEEEEKKDEGAEGQSSNA